MNRLKHNAKDQPFIIYRCEYLAYTLSLRENCFHGVTEHLVDYYNIVIQLNNIKQSTESNGSMLLDFYE